MPELLTKHPTVVIDVLESTGARCGDGLPQKILTKCPREAFCALPGGELCVYGLDEVDAMTQIDTDDLAPLVCTQSSPQSVAGGCAVAESAGGAMLFAAVLLAFAIDRRARRSRPAR